DHLGNDLAEIDERRRAGLLAAEARQVADDLARTAALRLHERDFLERFHGQPAMALEKLGRAKDRLQRVVQLVRDARYEDADGGEPLLPDHLALERLQHFADLALLLDLAIEGGMRLAQIRGHGDERFLKLSELAVGHRAARRRREIAVRDA